MRKKHILPPGKVILLTDAASFLMTRTNLFKKSLVKFLKELKKQTEVRWGKVDYF